MNILNFEDFKMLEKKNQDSDSKKALKCTKQSGGGVYKVKLSADEAKELAKLLKAKADKSEDAKETCYVVGEEDILIEPSFGVSFKHEEDEDYGFKTKVEKALTKLGYEIKK